MRWFSGNNNHALQQKCEYEAMSFTKLQKAVRRMILSKSYHSLSRSRKLTLGRQPDGRRGTSSIISSTTIGRKIKLHGDDGTGVEIAKAHAKR